MIRMAFLRLFPAAQARILHRRPVRMKPGGHGAQPSLALHVHRLRELQRLEAGCPAREVRQCNVRPGYRLGRRVEGAAGETRIGR